jgi:hypothetical protein
MTRCSVIRNGGEDVVRFLLILGSVYECERNILWRQTWAAPREVGVTIADIAGTPPRSMARKGLFGGY